MAAGALFASDALLAQLVVLYRACPPAQVSGMWRAAVDAIAGDSPLALAHVSERTAAARLAWRLLAHVIVDGVRLRPARCAELRDAAEALCGRVATL